MGKNKVELVADAGFCFGVKRCVLRAEQTAARYGDRPIYTFGPLIHNPQVVERLRSKGIVPIADPAQVPAGVVIVRSHGAERNVLKQAGKAGHLVVDATCPFVRRAQKLVARLSREGYQIVIIGEESHPEIRGLLSYANSGAVVVSDQASAEGLGTFPRIGVVAQTTAPSRLFGQVVGALLAKSKELQVHNTICQSTEQRRRATAELARRSEVMIIVGGRNSANTRRLVELCRQENRETYHIETASEVSEDWIRDRTLVGVSAGTSTPDWIIREVFDRLQAMTAGV